MKKNSVLLIICLTIVMTGIGMAMDAPARVKVLVPSEHMTYLGQSGTAPSSFLYREFSGSDPNQYDRFYTTTYGKTLGLRCYVDSEQYFPLYTENPVDRDSGKSWQCAGTSDLKRVAAATDFEAGYTDSENKISFYPGGMIINPAPVTYNGIEYDTGDLAVMFCWGYAGTDANTTKRLIAWDFREIFSYTDIDPDRDNAEWMTGMLITDVFGDEYGIGRTNWNDAFSSLVSLQDLSDAIGAGEQPGGKNVNDHTGSRQGAFSSDASKVYFVSKGAGSGADFGGLWSVELATKTVKRLFDNSAQEVSSIYCEPAVLPIGVRNLTGVDYDPNYDQIFFNGTDISGNVGGLVCVVDDGNEYPVHTIITADELIDFLEVNEPNYNDYSNFPEIMAVTVDDEGNLYLNAKGYNSEDSTPYAAIKYDLDGRMVAVSHRPMIHAFHESEGYIKKSHNTVYNRLQVRKVHVALDDEDPNDAGMDIPQIMYQSTTAKCVAGINVYPAGDFDLDGQVTLADLDFFKTQLQKSLNDEVPLLADDDYLDYVACDLNGNGNVLYDEDAKEYLQLEGPCVTEKDVEILHQFVLPGDVNLDGFVDATDIATVEANLGTTEGADWSQGDFDFDDDVDADDQALIAD